MSKEHARLLGSVPLPWVRAEISVHKDDSDVIASQGKKLLGESLFSVFSQKAQPGQRTQEPQIAARSQDLCPERVTQEKHLVLCAGFLFCCQFDTTLDISRHI